MSAKPSATKTGRINTLQFSRGNHMSQSKKHLARRDVLKLSAATAGLGAMGGLSACVTAAEQATAKSPIPGHVASAVPSRETLDAWLKRLHNFGPIRATGTPQCRAFEEFLAAEFQKLGCTIERDQFRLTSWECDIKDCSIEVFENQPVPPGSPPGTGKMSRRVLEVIAYYPFGGSTKNKEPVSGRVLFGGTGEQSGPDILKKYTEAELADAIVVVDMPLAGGGTRAVVQYYPESFPNPLPPRPTVPRIANQG